MPTPKQDGGGPTFASNDDCLGSSSPMFKPAKVESEGSAPLKESVMKMNPQLQKVTSKEYAHQFNLVRNMFGLKTAY